MATYKVIQDIEAEDKLVGPFSLRQFIYAAIAVVTGFIAYKFAAINILLVIPFVPIIALFGVLSAPFGHDQPSEVWLLARVRFFLKPHRRIWNQSGMINLVTITAPKTVQRNLTKNLSETEVTSRLHALANTIDSRGWAIKNVNVNLTGQVEDNQVINDSDRLVNPLNLPQDVPTADVTAADDIMDPTNNPTAQHLKQMIATADQQHHQQVINSMNNPAPQAPPTNDAPADYWFMNNASGQTQAPPDGYAKFNDDQVILPGEDPSNYSAVSNPDVDRVIAEQLEYNKSKEFKPYSHMHTINPLGAQPAHNLQNPINNQPTENLPPKTVTDPAIINMALANKDNWSVATTAHEAEKAQKKLPPQDEVIVSLH